MYIEYLCSGRGILLYSLENNMSGVIDDNGIQWERCNDCGEYTKFTELYNISPENADNRYGLVVCPSCADKRVHE